MRVRPFVARPVRLVKSAARRSRVCIMIKQFNANKSRLRRHRRMRNRLAGSQVRPRLSVFRSGQHIYAQIIDDTSGQTVAAASSIDESLRNFRPAQVAPTEEPETQETESAPVVEMAAEVAPSKGKGAKVQKAPQKPPAKGGQPQKGAPSRGGKPAAQVKTLLPAAQKGEAKTQ